MFANDISRKLIVKFKLSLALPLPAVTSRKRGRLIIIAIAGRYIQFTL